MAPQQHNHNAGGGCCTVFRAKVLIGLLALAFGLYIIGPPLYWHAVEEGAGAGSADSHSASCPICDCDCDSENLAAIALSGLGNLTLGAAECGSEDQGWHSDAQASKEELLREELQLQEAVADDTKKRAESAYLDAKKLASQYQKEAEKCNIGMETSEEARERAEAALEAERKRSALWRQRAKELGWSEGGSGSGVRVRSKAETQVSEPDDPADMQLKVIHLDEVKEEVRDPELNVQVTGEGTLGSSSSSRYKKKKYGKRKKRSSTPSL